MLLRLVASCMSACMARIYTQVHMNVVQICSSSPLEVRLIFSCAQSKLRANGQILLGVYRARARARERGNDTARERETETARKGEIENENGNENENENSNARER
jgi:hypothetical protein